ncbi:hypothetical protein H2201_009230 [Coniosporium apollinis]|uniref:Uncharacterized protein n=1 Tax=Coniosporium apollinis TaxID=61459 RepID=A0ABQ9NHE0_9PEZI|nr:hypothetical protein H2201_009230 [Coniosporium apollinis]
MDASRDSQWPAAPNLAPPYTSASTQSRHPSLLEEAEASVRRPSTPDIAEPSSRRRSMLDIEEPSQPPKKRTPSPDPGPYSSLPPPPDYTAFNTANINFRIQGTFITAALTSGEARYQLSTTLDHDMRELRIRRLTPSESRRLVTDPSTPLRFEKDRTLYALYKDLFNSAVRVIGPEGEIRIDYYFKRWRVYYVTKDKKKDMLYKVRRGQKGLEWEDEAGKVVATETADGAVFWPPLLRLNADMDEKIRDLLVACWVGRMWYWIPAAATTAQEVSSRERIESGE